MGAQNELTQKLEAFISKYYKNLLLKGALYFTASSLLFFLFISFAEHFGNFGTTIRTVLFWSFITTTLFILWKWIIAPLKGLYRVGSMLSQEDAAKIIGDHFSEVEDKLLNLLQLVELSNSENELIDASIQQKSEELNPIPFLNAIDFSENKRYLKYALIPVVILLFLFFSGNKSVVTESSARIISHNTHFEPKAPFLFVLDNENLQGVKGEDFLLKMHFKGNEIPTNAYIVIEGNRHRLKGASGNFTHLIKNPQEDLVFQFWADGFFSESMAINIIPKPIIKSFETHINYPTYTGLKDESIRNKGNIRVPEGAKIHWLFETENAKKLFFKIKQKEVVEQKGEERFEIQKTVYQSSNYGLFVQNNNLNGDSIFYQLEVIKDAFPSIKLSEAIDSNDHYLRFFEGLIQDDYGFRSLTFNYRTISNKPGEWHSTELSITKNNQQGFYHHWNLSEASLAAGESVEFFFEVWDNDAVNGSKSSRSKTMVHKAPTKEEHEQQSENNNESLKTDIEETLKLAQEVQQELENLDKQLLEEKELSWEDKQKAQSLLEKQEKLQKKVEEIQQQQSLNQQEENRFEQPNEELLKKQEMLQELFENIMTEEMKDMMEELKKMMDDINKDELQKMLDEMQQNDEDLEKELDRSLELFKQLELQQKLENTIEKLDKLADKQEELSEQTQEKGANKEELQEEQKKLNEEFEKIQEELKKAEKLNQELEEKQKLPDMSSEEEQIQEEMQNSLEQLQKNMKKKSSKSQKSAAQKMEEMSKKLQSSMQQSESDSATEDMATLRQILENLITLSLDQETLLSNITETNINSPLYTNHIQQQKKLQNDAQIIEDSLFALSKRQPQVKSIVNKEINALNNSMEKALSWMEERASGKASERQQFAMTSANNLALLLSETLKQMQQQMSQQSDSQSKKMCNKPNSTGGQSMKQLKGMQEKLKKQMEQMMKNQKGSGDKGKGKKKMGKELAKMAAQQEMIRKRMQEIREELSGDQQAKKSIDKMLKQMEETETDIINRNITQQTLLRQQEILSKLLEAEKAHREREKDKERQSKEWLQDISNRLVNPLEDYQKEKEKQEELLRTVPPALTPFYKNKVNEYFQEDGR